MNLSKRSACFLPDIILFSFVALVIGGCASWSRRAPYKMGYDFKSVEKVYVEEFKSVSNEAYSNSGAVVRDAFVLELLRRGYKVLSDPSSADAVISGSVMTYNPEKRYIIMLQKPGEKRIVNQQLTEIPGSNVYSFGSAFGLKEDNQILVSNAIVGVAANMRDARTGEVVWSNDFTYEGLDLASALSGVASYLIKTIPRQ